MTIRTERDPAVQRPAVVTAALDVSGRTVVVHAAADTPLDAIDLIERRLRRSLDRLDSRRRARRRKSAVAESEASLEILHEPVDASRSGSSEERA